ncbi:MAG: YggS family pyridoxal phosphate-dependent enzyme [Bacteroidia bacterium]|nr:YggS family pyridoxal phosphate-dependent enzyme [Bacteroidia bacterium]
MSHSIRENITQIRQEIGNAELVVVSKYRSIEELNQVYETNQRNFAENRVQELTKKKELMPDDIHWHMIGNLQTNKVKFIAPFIHLIQSVDRIKLLKEINKEAKKNNRVIPILFQVHIAEEEHKFGFSLYDLTTMIESNQLSEFNNIEVKGLMGMATNTTDKKIVTTEFIKLKSFFDKWKNQMNWSTLSMGMSGDYIEAIECGSTLIRVGSKIFQ